MDRQTDGFAIAYSALSMLSRANKSKLTATRFYCFINGKIKKEPEKPRVSYKRIGSKNRAKSNVQ